MERRAYAASEEAIRLRGLFVDFVLEKDAKKGLKEMLKVSETPKTLALYISQEDL